MYKRFTVTDGNRCPTRVAFVSDPHGDCVAFRQVIADLEASQPVDEVLVGGDVAQGGPQPAEVVDEIRRRGWRSVRGNSDDFLVNIADGMAPSDALRGGEAAHGALPDSAVERARWSVSRLGPERIEYLRSLPMSIELGPYPFGRVLLVHATPWSTEDVVLPDAERKLAQRMVREAGARLVVYGHIHTQYHRKVGDGVLVSVGAVSGSNDADPRPAYAIVNLGLTISVEARRVEWPAEDRIAAYAEAGVEPRSLQMEAGPFPIRTKPGVPVTVWP